MAAPIVLTMCITVSTASGATVESPDTVGDVGQASSLALDAAGNPVVSYRDSTNQDLKVLHCNDPNCAGGDDSIESPDTTGFVGLYTSLALDAAGNPVISYLDNTNLDLKVMHCNDPDCAGGDESIESPDTIGNVGYYTSLELDAAGNPVVSYYDQTNGDLKVLHCNDENCAPGGNTVERMDVAGDVGTHTSLALDGVGHPVISYHDVTNSDLKVVHCDIASCADGQLSYSLDTTGIVGSYTSLALDGSGNPVVSYHDVTNGDLKLLHCYDPACATGGTIERVDLTGMVGLWTSLALDGSGKPVISYLDATNSALKVVHCDIASCADGQLSVSVDNAGDVGSWSSLVLDSAGNPVISYHDATTDLNGDLKVLHCDNPTCAPPMTSITPLAPPVGTNGWYNADAFVVVSVADPGVVETRCVLDPAIAPSTFDELPAGCNYLGTGAAVTADGQHTLYAASIDSAGTKETPVSVSFKIDQTDPSVAYSGNAATYTVDQQVNIDCAATDFVSGIESTTCADVVGFAGTFGLGAHGYNASATDNAGNTSTGSVSFTVAVSPATLCKLTLQLAQGSARYQGSTARQQNTFNQSVSAVCAVTLTPISSGISAAKKRVLIAAYKLQLELLVAGTWLTRAEADSLGALASGL